MKKLLRVLLKVLIGVVAVLFLLFASLRIIYSDDIPVGKSDADADVGGRVRRGPGRQSARDLGLLETRGARHEGAG